MVGPALPNCVRGSREGSHPNLPSQEWRAPPLLGVDGIEGSPTGEQTFLAFDPRAWCPQLGSTAPAGLIPAHGFCWCKESKELAPGGTKGRESRLGLSQLLRVPSPIHVWRGVEGEMKEGRNRACFCFFLQDAGGAC